MPAHPPMLGVTVIVPLLPWLELDVALMLLVTDAPVQLGGKVHA